MYSVLSPAGQDRTRGTAGSWHGASAGGTGLQELGCQHPDFSEHTLFVMFQEAQRGHHPACPAVHPRRGPCCEDGKPLFGVGCQREVTSALPNVAKTNAWRHKIE